MKNQWDGYRPESAEKFLLNAGAFYKNSTMDDATGEFTGTRLGATQGGGSLNIEPEMRNIEVDGVPTNSKGLSIIDDFAISLTANLMEVTTDNIQSALVSSDVDKVTNDVYDIITLRRTLLDTDYIENIAWVGRKSDNTPMIIIIDNALNTEGLSVDMAPKSEGVIPVTFTGHADLTEEEDLLPLRIYQKKKTVIP